MPKMKSPDGIIPYEAMRLEYITSDKSLNQLVKSYQVGRNSVYRKAKQEDWVAQRAEYRESLGTKTLARTIEKQAEADSDRLVRIDSICDRMIDQIEKAMDNYDQLCMHLVQRKSKHISKDSVSKTSETTENEWAEATVTEMINGRNVSDLSASLKNLQFVKRLHKGLMTAEAERKLDLEREKLELSKRQTGMSDDIEQESGIALMPGVDESLLDNAIPDPGDMEAVDEQGYDYMDSTTSAGRIPPETGV